MKNTQQHKATLTAIVCLIMSQHILAKDLRREEGREQKLSRIEESKRKLGQLKTEIRDVSTSLEMKARKQVEFSKILLELKDTMNSSFESFEIKIKAATTFGQICHNSKDWACRSTLEIAKGERKNEQDRKILNIAGRMSYPKSYQEIPSSKGTPISRRILAQKNSQMDKPQSPFQQLLTRLGF